MSQAISGALTTIHNQSPWEDWPSLLWPLLPPLLASDWLCSLPPAPLSHSPLLT